MTSDAAPYYLRLIDGSARPPRLRPLDVNVRINAFTRRKPCARSREFRLSHDDFAKLITVAEKLESRR